MAISMSADFQLWEIMSAQLELFESKLPHRPYCANEKGPLRVRPRATAIKHRYIQHNQPSLAHWLVFDCDYYGVLEHISQNQLPVPNLVATNPKNGHSHAFYKLADAVCTSDLARQKPLRLLAAIEHALGEALNADEGYQGLISKNVLHADWLVQEVAKEPWQLGDFLEWIDIPKRLPTKALDRGLGRNCALFDALRLWAYRDVLAYRIAGAKDAFTDAVHRRCEALNVFPEPLPASEVRSIAKSVARWTWKNYTGRVSDEAFSKKQAARGKLGGLKKGQANAEKRAEALKMASMGLSARAISAALDVNHSTVSRWFKK